MARERPPAGRFAPRAVPLGKGDRSAQQCPPYEGGRPRSEATGRGSLTSHVYRVVLFPGAFLYFGTSGSSVLFPRIDR
jgi:hypothetical protein